MENLKIGFLISNEIVHAYQAELIRTILNDVRFSIATIIIFNDCHHSKTNVSSIKTLFWKVWLKHFLTSQAEALTTINLTKELSVFPKIKINFLQNESLSYYTDDKTISVLNEFNLDIIINCQNKTLCNTFLSIPNKGVWSFDYNTNPCIGFWEFYFKKSLIKISLQQLAENPQNNLVLRTGFFATDFTSIAKTHDKILFESASWIKSTLARYWNNPNITLDSTTISSTSNQYKEPSNIQMLCFFLKTYWRKVIKSFNNFFFYTAWNVAILSVSIEKLTNNAIKKDAKWLPKLPWPQFQADPFGIEIDGKQIIFLEEGNHKNAIGEIKTIALSSTLDEISRLHVNTQFNCHHSYPFVFHDKGSIYIIPECLQSKETLIYKMIDSQGTLKKHATLLTGLPVIDPSLLFYNDYYWIFCTLSSPYTDGCTSLYIFYSKILEGPYHPHLLNPVKTDIQTSRPAGTFFYKNNKLHRPAQDCSNGYGSAIKILKIEKLSPTEFSEEIVDTLTPHPKYPAGLHTLSSLGENIVLIDGKQHACSLKKALSTLFPHKTTLTPATLATLETMSGDIHFSNINKTTNHFFSTGIDNDGWCAENLNLFVRVSKETKKLLFEVIFPGWQVIKKQKLKIVVNDKLLITSYLNIGISVIEVPLLTTHSVIKINIRSQSTFRIPFPDNRYRAFQLCKINFS